MNPKSIFICIFITCLSTALIAQPDRFNVGIDFYPNLSINFGESDERAIQKGKISNTIGFTLAYEVNQKFSLESGLRFINKGQRRISGHSSRINIGDQFLRYDRDEESVHVRHNYNYIGIPLNFRLALGEKLDKGWFLKIGTTASHYYSSNIRVNYYKEMEDDTFYSTEDEDDIRKTHLNVNYGIGYAFLIREKYQLSVEPMFEYMLYKLYHKNRLEERYYSFGLHIQMMIL